MLGPRIRALRLARGWSQATLAERAGLGQGYCSRLERGLQRPGLVVICRLAAAFDLSLDALVQPLTAAPAGADREARDSPR